MGCLDDSTILRFVSGQIDDAARARVESEIGSCRECAALVAELLRGGGTLCAIDAPEVTAPPVDAPAAPSRYRLGPVIARGGMGTVLAAFDRRLRRSVAIKVLDDAGPSLVARFEREIRVTASLQHPGIVPIYDAGELPDGRPFYAMRHVPGASLEQAMRDGGDARRLGLVVSVLAAADAVAYAHERGILHRDLKPANILVGPFGETVVIDWGLAAIGEDVEVTVDELGGDSATTRQGSVLGTPRYMAPEQARGEPATRRSDVYALGAILYHTLSGVPSVAGDDVSVVLERVARAEVCPLHEVAPALPGDLVAIVERAMAPAADARYASAGELADDLRRFQTGQLVAAHRYSRRDLVLRFMRRHRAAVVFAALLVAVLAIGGTLSVRGVVREREHAEAEQDRAEHERAGAEDLVQFLLHELRARLQTVGRLDVLSGVADRVEAYYMTTAAGRAEQPDALRGRAELYDLRAAVARAAGDAEATDAYLQRGLELLDRARGAPGADETRAGLLADRAANASQHGKFDIARALYLEALALYRRGAPTTPEQQRKRDLNLAVKLKNAGLLAERLAHPLDAEHEWQEAGEILERRRAADPGDTEVARRIGELHLAVGQSRYRRGQLGAAEGSLEAALADGERLAVREKNADVQYLIAWACISLADLRNGRGDVDGAAKLRERAGEVADTMLAVEPASVLWQNVRARAEADLGQIALDRKDWAVAARRFEQARAASEVLTARDPTNREYRRAAAIAAAQLAEADAGLGRFDLARAAWLGSLEQLARLARTNAVEGPMEWAYGLRGYAEFERLHGKMAAAVGATERAVALVDDTPSDHDRPVVAYYRASVIAELAAERARQGDRRGAVAAWRRAADLLRGVAARVPLEPEWANKLREIEAALGGGGS